jgi:hypothetical protein
VSEEQAEVLSCPDAEGESESGFGDAAYGAFGGESESGPRCDGREEWVGMPEHVVGDKV